MPEFMGWWMYVVGVPLGGGALLTLFSLGGRGRKGAHRGHSAPKAGHAHHLPHLHLHHHKGGSSHKVVAPKTAAPKATPGKTGTRQTRAAELPPLFLAQNFLLIWSLVALCAVPFQPQKAHPVTLTLILSAVALLTVILLAVSVQLFVRLTPVDASSISRKSDLQGRVGECDATIDSRRGSLLVRDEFGTLHHLAARSEEPVARGEAVLLIEYQANGDYFDVRVWRD